MDQITGYDRQTIRLFGGTELLMAKSKYSAFADAYLRFLRGAKEC